MREPWALDVAPRRPPKESRVDTRLKYDHSPTGSLYCGGCEPDQAQRLLLNNDAASGEELRCGLTFPPLC